MKKSKLRRQTNSLCPHCRKGYIIDQRATCGQIKELPNWICSNILANCNYRKKYGKDWQWSSWDWDPPIFIEISETSEEFVDRKKYEEEIKKKSKDFERDIIAEEKLINGLKICRVCGKNNCIKINNCL